MFIRMRFEAARLARTLRRSLCQEPDMWKIDRLEVDEEEHPCLRHGLFQITLIPRRLRFADSIHVYCDGAEVWLPLVSRLRLRNTARWFLARHGNEQLQPQPKAPHRRVRHAHANNRLTAKAK